MQEILTALTEIQTDLPWRNIFIGLLMVVVAQFLLKVSDWFFQQFIQNKKDKRRFLSKRKVLIYCYNFLLILLFLKVVQVEMKVVLGAAGLFTIAIGFAARTPISNFISGIFLFFERPFVVGDIIEVNGFRGEVIARNLLSLTMRTLDNLMVRIPNEDLMSNSVSNISYFPIRRLDVKYLISNKDSLTRLEEIFSEVASRNGLALDEPKPYFYVTEFKENSIEVKFKVWSTSDDFLFFQSEFPKEIHRAIKAAGMEFIRNRVEIMESVTVLKGESLS